LRTIRSRRQLSNIYYYPSKPFSISRRIASDLEGFGSGWCSIHSAIRASNASGQRTVRTGSLPVAGRPRGLFCISAIDPSFD